MLVRIANREDPGPKVINFSMLYSAEPEISTIVGILTFISMINTTSDCRYFSFYELWNFVLC